ncbi:MAG: methyltransferase domain-containing protein, partial [Roseimicrobium sp.]
MPDWNACYERRETPWDKGLPTPVLSEVAARHPGIFCGRVLVPGCGTGHDARWLAEQNCEVTGADIAPLAIERARVLDPDQRVASQLVDVLDLPEDLRG